MKQLENLPNNIYKLFDPACDHEVDEKNVEIFLENAADILRTRLRKAREHTGELYLSSIGKPDRQLWYEANPLPKSKEPMLPKTYLKFMYGDLIEEMLLFLCREAGHEVEGQQKRVEVSGVRGKIDAIIDGVVVDVKSASPFAYKKFEDGRVIHDDPFGYVHQLSGYANLLTPGEGASWLAFDKVAGDICVSSINYSIVKHYKPEERIKELKEIIGNESPPERCYEPVPDGKSDRKSVV